MGLLFFGRRIDEAAALVLTAGALAAGAIFRTAKPQSDAEGIPSRPGRANFTGGQQRLIIEN